MFSSLKDVLCYTKIIVITPGGVWWCCELRKISDTELKLLIISSIHQKQLPERVLLKKCSQKFRKTDVKKPVLDTDIDVFLSILQNIQEQFFYWTPPVAVSSSFKATGFTEAVMQPNFWTSQNLVDLNALVLVGIFVFIFGKHKLSFVSWWFL